MFPDRLSAIDKLALPDHRQLTEADNCYYLGEYTARESYRFSETNNVISNFKKELDRRGKREWVYKENAIQEIGNQYHGVKIKMYSKLDAIEKLMKYYEMFKEIGDSGRPNHIKVTIESV